MMKIPQKNPLKKGKKKKVYKPSMIPWMCRTFGHNTNITYTGAKEKKKKIEGLKEFTYETMIYVCKRCGYKFVEDGK